MFFTSDCHISLTSQGHERILSNYNHLGDGEFGLSLAISIFVMKNAVLLIIIMNLPVMAAAEKPKVYGAHPGYVENVSVEYDELVEEVYPVEDPRAHEPSINEFLFDEKLTKEFKQKYEDFFGRTEVEQNRTAINRFDDLEYSANILLTPEQDLERRRDYGVFVLRRLSEHHVDQYARNNEDLKQVYEVKQRISNLDVKSEQGYSFNINYRLSDNSFHMKLENPWEIKTRYSLYMDTAHVGPASVVERQLSLNYDLTPKTTVGTYYKEVDGTISVVGKRVVKSDLTASITGKTYVKEEGISTRENSIIFGLSWAM